MELIAKDNHGDIWEVYAYDRLFVWAMRHGEKQGFEIVYDSPIRGQATLHVSTGMTDKNGREILVGDRLRDKIGDEWKVMYDGKQWLIFWTMNPVLLTPELAATMEVVS